MIFKVCRRRRNQISPFPLKFKFNLRECQLQSRLLIKSFNPMASLWFILCCDSVSSKLLKLQSKLSGSNTKWLPHLSLLCLFPVISQWSLILFIRNQIFRKVCINCFSFIHFLHSAVRWIFLPSTLLMVETEDMYSSIILKYCFLVLLLYWSIFILLLYATTPLFFTGKYITLKLYIKNHMIIL